MKNLDLTTFGNFQSAIDLVTELNYRPEWLSRKVRKFLADYIGGLHEILNLEKSSHRKRIADMWKHDFLIRVDFNSEIDSFVKNVIVAHHRKNID